MRHGYKASAEQFAPRELIDYSIPAEEPGLSTIAVSDHFQPRRHTGGHTSAVLPWLYRDLLESLKQGADSAGRDVAEIDKSLRSSLL